MRNVKAVKTFIDNLGRLEKSILKSKSPKHYKEVLEFFRDELLVDQAFIWREQVAIPQPGRDGEPLRQKFLAIHKTSLEEFSVYCKKFERVNFSTAMHFDENLLYMKLTADNGEHFCFAIKGYPVFLKKDEVCAHMFVKRMAGLMNMIDTLDEIQTMNFEDDVTGLYNQRYLNILLDQEIERYKRSNVSFSVLFIDVDHFKMVNDKNGHMVGSQVLKEIGQIIKKSVRTVDFCFRYGGDEFLTVLTSTTTEQATAVANRICRSVRETPFIVDGKRVQVTLSIGVACFPEHAQTKEKILQVADEAMYCGKNLSRNVVYLAS